MMIKCSKCGFENQMGAIFCRQCGEKIDMNALSPEALEESRGKEERKKKAAGLIRNLVGIVLLLAIVGIGAGLFVPWGHPAYQAPEEDKEMETKLDLLVRTVQGREQPGLVQKMQSIENRLLSLELLEHSARKQYGRAAAVIAFIINAGLAVGAWFR